MNDEHIELVEKAKSGDTQAFGRIYQYYYKKVFRYCAYNCPNRAAAEDICQEAFVKAWKSLPKFSIKKNGTIQAYLFAIARNMIIDQARRKKEVKLEDYEYIETMEDLFEEVDKKSDIVRMQTAIKRLEESEQQIVILRYFEEMSTLDIAKVLGLKDGAVRVRLHRIHEKLKVLFETNHGRKS